MPSLTDWLLAYGMLACRATAAKLHDLAVSLVACLEKLEMPEGVEEDDDEKTKAEKEKKAAEEAEKKDKPAGIPAQLADVLAPKGHALSINDESPLELAYDMNDLEFMSAPVVQGYLMDRWLGPDYKLQALQVWREAGTCM